MQIQFLYDKIVGYNPDVKHSRVKMVHWLIKQQRSRDWYVTEIEELTCTSVKFSTISDQITHQQMKYLHGYVVQNILIAFFSEQETDLSDLLELSWEHTVNMMEEHASMLSFEEGFTSSSGHTRSGTKTEIAQLIFKEHFDPENPKDSGKIIKDLFISELDMGKSGATTYYHKIKRALP